MPRVISVAYQRHLVSDAWRNKRLERLALDERKCVRCQATEHLEVHHKTYERLGSERMEDLVTLCRDCHKREHGRDPDLPGVISDSYVQDRVRERAILEIEQEDIAIAAGVDLRSYFDE